MLFVVFLIQLCRLQPTLFITMTCNHHWPEVTNSMEEGQNYNNRPDIVSNVIEKKLFGPVSACLYQLNFKNVGWHMGLLLVTFNFYFTSEQINAIVPAEILNERTHPKLCRLVADNMFHGPCGTLNPKSVCIRPETQISYVACSHIKYYNNKNYIWFR